jgi:hypothetical protein
VIEDQQLLVEFENYIVPSRDLVFTIRALGRTSGGGRFVRQAVVELDPSREQPFLIYAWTRGALPDSAG